MSIEQESQEPRPGKIYTSPQELNQAAQEGQTDVLRIWGKKLSSRTIRGQKEIILEDDPKNPEAHLFGRILALRNAQDPEKLRIVLNVTDPHLKDSQTGKPKLIPLELNPENIIDFQIELLSEKQFKEL